MTSSTATQEQRILVLAPTGKDAALTRSVFQKAGLECLCCSDVDQICVELDAGAGAVVIAEEAVGFNGRDGLSEWLARQPPWSDLAVLVLARPGADSAAVTRAMDLLGNVTVLERPMRIASLVSATRTALRGRLRQYQTRDYLLERERTEATLRENDRRKDEFLAILAHELRNPLAPIRNSLHILRSTRDRDPSIGPITEIMSRQVYHMVRLIDDLLEVSRITRGKIELRKERVEIAAVVRSAVEVSRPLIDAAQHQLHLAIPETPLIVDADPVRLAQVFTNLLNNAAKYTNPGGQIWLTMQRDGGKVAIHVRDTGTGIPAEKLPHIFDLFMQVDHSTSRAQGGLGIGLTLVKNLVEMHGGTVGVFSAGHDRGSEFVVRLTLADGQYSTEECERVDQPAAVLAGRRVLVVDDNRDSADSLGRLLNLLGVDVRVEYSGADALNTMTTFLPSVVVLDIGMPGLDGLEVARQIRSQDAFQHVVLVALTDWGQQEAIHKTLTAGFHYHLVKPASVETLQTLLFSLDTNNAQSVSPDQETT